MKNSSSNPLIFHRFFSHDWEYGLFAVEEELGYTYYRVMGPLFLAKILYRRFFLEDGLSPREAFIGFFLNAITPTGRQIVSIPRFGVWEAKWQRAGKQWEIAWCQADKEIKIQFKQWEVTSCVKRMYKDWGRSPGSHLWLFAEQLREGCPEDVEIEEFFIKEDVSAIKLALELWLLRQGPLKVPTEKKVTFRKWINGLQSGLKGKVSISLEPGFTINYLLDGGLHKTEAGTIVLIDREEAEKFFIARYGKIAAFKEADYLQMVYAWLRSHNIQVESKEELMKLNPTWTLLEEYQKLTPSQRIAVFSLPSHAWEELSQEDWNSKWAKHAAFIKQVRQDGIEISPSEINEYTLNIISEYWKSRISGIDITTSEKFGVSRRDARIKQVPFWEGTNYPMGMAFASPSILALVWAEIFWCVLHNIEVQTCKNCGEIFTPKKAGEFCSKKCWENYQVTEGGIRSRLKELHQQLSRLSGKVGTGHADIKDYLELWRKWESLKLQTEGRERQAKKIHPGMIVLRTAEGRKVAQDLRWALREKDKYVEEKAWESYSDLLRKYSIPQPPKEWVISFLKNSST